MVLLGGHPKKYGYGGTFWRARDLMGNAVFLLHADERTCLFAAWNAGTPNSIDVLDVAIYLIVGRGQIG